MEIRKRKPLSDITNAYDLIPTSTLRKLVSSSGSISSPALKPPNSILKPNASFGGQKVCHDSSPTLNGVDTRSDTTIASSVNNAHAPTSRTVRFQNRDLRTKDILYDGRQTTDEFNYERRISVMTDSFTSLAKKEDKGKAIVGQFSFTPPWRIGKLCSSLEKTEEKDMENLSPFSGSFEKKGILNPSTCSHEKTDNRNANPKDAGCSKNKLEELGKGITNHLNYSFDKKKDEQQVILELPGSSVQKTKVVGKATLNSNSFLVEKTKEKLKSLSHSGYPPEKTKEKRKDILALLNMVEGSAAAVAVNCRPVRRKTVKTKKGTGASSCPPVRRTRKIPDDFGEARDVKSSKSLTVPRPKFKKIKSVDESCLPLDFIEQQRAYFKEVDEFELAEEEISQDELD